MLPPPAHLSYGRRFIEQALQAAETTAAPAGHSQHSSAAPHAPGAGAADTAGGSAPAAAHAPQAFNAMLTDAGARARSEASHEANVAITAARATSGRMCGTQASPAFLPVHAGAESLHYTKHIAPESMAQLPASDEAFTNMVASFHFARGHLKFKLPIITGREVHLRPLFDTVQLRGGYAAVCRQKAWKDVVCPAACSLLLGHVSRCHHALPSMRLMTPWHHHCNAGIASMLLLSHLLTVDCTGCR